MLKIDLHIHTISSSFERKIEFSLPKLQEYVEYCSLDVIAITNHNLFDESQYRDIKKTLINTLVLPGIEIDIEKSHMLVIGDEHKIDELKNLSDKLTGYIKSENDSIDYDVFVKVLPTFKDYILIPHYEKEPKMKSTTLTKLEKEIYSGEVRSAKQFEVIKKQENKLVPVLFSDIRMEEEIKKFPSRFTYLDIDEKEFDIIGNAMKDINKVFISRSKEDSKFEFLPDGTLASSKLNVILGKRSSGKTYKLDMLNLASVDNNIKYIKQFSLTGNSEEKKFNELIRTRQNNFVIEYLKEFKDVTNLVLDIDTEYDNTIDKYLSSLKEHAENQSLNDVYSKCVIFNEDHFNPNDNLDTKHLIIAIVKILDSDHNKDLVNMYNVRVPLTELLYKLISKRKNEYKNYLLRKETDEILKYVKGKLAKRSSQKIVENVDLYEVMSKKIRIDKYNSLCKKLRVQNLIDEEEIGRFEVKVNRTRVKNSGRLKEILETGKSLSDIFKSYDNPYKYVKKLEEAGIKKELLYKCQFDFEVTIVNEKGSQLSGGERAEYNLLHEIEDSEKYDMLLLDEPEASFDNPFINEHILSLIKEISNKTTVFLSTHNSTLGMLIQPNLIIFTEEKDGIYKTYTGEVGAKHLKHVSGDEIDSYESIIGVMEAGEKPYKERRVIYESFRNK